MIAARRVPDRLPERRLRRAVQGASSTRCARPKPRKAGGHAPDRGGGALPLQADGLQGRVRGRAPAHRPARSSQKIGGQFEGDYKLKYHLAPPLLAKRNDKGELVKQKFGPWMLTAFGVLAKLKGLRGTPFDIFGRTEERKTERALIGEYQATVDELLAHAECRQPGAGGRDRPHPGRDPRLRPREGAPPQAAKPKEDPVAGQLRRASGGPISRRVISRENQRKHSKSPVPQGPGLFFPPPARRPRAGAGACPWPHSALSNSQACYRPSPARGRCNS